MILRVGKLMSLDIDLGNFKSASHNIVFVNVKCPVQWAVSGPAYDQEASYWENNQRKIIDGIGYKEQTKKCPD